MDQTLGMQVSQAEASSSRTLDPSSTSLPLSPRPTPELETPPGPLPRPTAMPPPFIPLEDGPWAEGQEPSLSRISLNTKLQRYFKCLEEKYTLQQQAQAKQFINKVPGCLSCRAARKPCSGPRGDIIPSRQRLPLSCEYCYTEKKMCSIVVKDSDLKDYYQQKKKPRVKTVGGPSGSHALPPSANSLKRQHADSDPDEGNQTIKPKKSRAAGKQPMGVIPHSQFGSAQTPILPPPRASGSNSGPLNDGDAFLRLMLMKKADRAGVSGLLKSLGEKLSPEHSRALYAIGAKMWDLDEEFGKATFGDEVWKSVEVKDDAVGLAYMFPCSHGFPNRSNPFEEHRGVITGGRGVFKPGGMFTMEEFTFQPESTEEDVVEEDEEDEEEELLDSGDDSSTSGDGGDKRLDTEVELS